MPLFFPFPPDWASPVEVELAYKTEVLRSRNFREQRIALRQQPRKTFTFEVSIMRDAHREFIAQLHTRQQSEWVVPEIVRSVKTSVITASGGTSLSFAPVPAWMAPLSWIVVKLPSGYALRQLIAVDADSVTFAMPLSEVVPEGTEVFPGLVGRIVQSLRASMPTNSVLKGRIELSADPGTNVYEGPSTAPVVFNGRELFLRRSNWGSAPSLDFDGFLETADYDRGRVAHFEPVNWNTLKFQKEFMLKGQGEVDSFTAFLHRMRGQRGELYLPSGGSDFDLVLGAASGDSYLEVPGTDAFTRFAVSPVHRAIFVKFRDGTYQANVVEEVVLASGRSRFVVTDPWVQAVSPATTVMASWLYAARLASDTVSIEWLTREVARTKLTFQTLEDLP